MNTKTYIVGISGGTGSGKTTIAEKIVEHFRDKATYIPHDRYYKDQSHLEMPERVKTNYDHPDALETDLFIKHLRSLIKGENIELPEYDFTKHTRKLGVTTTVSPTPLIIIEGILIFENEELRNMCDLTVYVDVAADIRILRRTIRDIQERGRTLESCYDQYVQTSRPMHEKFVEPTKQYADIIIPHGGFNEKGIRAVIHTVEELLGMH